MQPVAAMGYKVVASCLVLGFADLLLRGVADAQSACQTPRGEVGECLNLKTSCPELLNLLASMPRKPEDTEYVRRSQCGFVNNDPLVCCPVRQQEQPPVQPPVQPISPPITNPGNGNVNPTSRLLPEECGKEQLESDRLWGGNIADINEFPWMVLLEYRNSDKIITACAGVLISRRYVLTAAQCVNGLPKSLTLESVRLGEYDTKTDRDCIQDGKESDMICADDPVSVAIEEQIIHEDFNRTEKRHDIALLRLTHDIIFTNFIQPICLPSNSNINRKLQVAGWGKTEDTSKVDSEIKHKFALPLVDKAKCENTYSAVGMILGEGQFCAGGQPGRDTCQGDSGGPLMQREKNDDGTSKWVSVGIVSFGPNPCGRKDWPSVYTMVYHYMPWLLGKLRP